VTRALLICVHGGRRSVGSFDPGVGVWWRVESRSGDLGRGRLRLRGSVGYFVGFAGEVVDERGVVLPLGCALALYRGGEGRGNKASAVLMRRGDAADDSPG